jgi:hypothetical protein
VPVITPWLLVGIESSTLGGEISITGAVRAMNLPELSVQVSLSVATEIPFSLLLRPDERLAFSVRRPNGQNGAVAVGEVVMAETAAQTWMVSAAMKVSFFEVGWHTFTVHGLDDRRVLVESAVLVRLVTTPVWRPKP